MSQKAAVLGILILSGACATDKPESQARSNDWPRYEYYQSADGWRWRLKARNGSCLADSGQPFPDSAGVLSSIEKARNGGPEPIVERNSGCR